MSSTLDDVYNQVLTLPDASKESLAERLVAYIETHVAPEVEQAHLEEAIRRRDEVRSGRVIPLDGPSVLAKTRRVTAQ